MLLLAGTSEWVVSRRLGHAHVQTTLDFAARVNDKPIVDEASARAAITETSDHVTV